MIDIQKGDEVQLKNDTGHRMLVEKIHDGKADCAWYVYDKRQVKKATLNLAILTKVK
jgi:uncharacterized protein YodC (DUF2158 family)